MILKYIKIERPIEACLCATVCGGVLHSGWLVVCYILVDWCCSVLLWCLQNRTNNGYRGNCEITENRIKTEITKKNKNPKMDYFQIHEERGTSGACLCAAVCGGVLHSG